MSKDKLIGLLIFLGSLVFGALYYLGITTPAWEILTIKILMSLGVLFMVLIGIWLGIEMMRTPSFDTKTEAKKEAKPEAKPEEKKE